MREKYQNQIYEYLRTFFGTIRDFFEKESQYGKFVPDMFKFPYLFLVFECIDGYVVAAYPSGIADNYVYIDQNKPVSAVLSKLPNKILGADNHVVIGVDKWGGHGRYTISSFALLTI